MTETTTRFTPATLLIGTRHMLAGQSGSGEHWGQGEYAGGWEPDEGGLNPFSCSPSSKYAQWYCLAGGICGLEQVEDSFSLDGAGLAALVYLKHAIEETGYIPTPTDSDVLYGNREWVESVEGIIGRWNDTPHRTWAEVESVLRRAEELAVEEGWS